MFDKNQFKVVFRRFVEAHPSASDEEVLEFCRLLIPPHLLASHYWLLDQSLQWFRWVRSQRAVHADCDLCKPELNDDVMCH